jgi:predicted anti-sigma-YlaC factor YlaD
MMTVFSEFFRRLFHKPAPVEPVSLAELSFLADDPEAMLTCDQVFALIDQYSERAARGEDVTHLMPLVAAHLDMCPDCREHYEALERVLQAE